MGDVPRPGPDPGLGRAGARQGAQGRPVRVPDLPAQADRRLPPADRPAAERVLRRVPGRVQAVRLRAAARLRRRARQVDGAQGRRAAPDLQRQHAPPRPPGGPAPGPARHLAPRPLGARAPGAHAGGRRASARRLAHGPQAPLARTDRGPRPRGRAGVPEGHRLRRRGALEADHRRRQHVDRDDAVQLPPARARQARQGRDQGRRRHADGAQHDRDLGRDHDGHERHEDEPRLPRGHRRQHRARHARPLLRRRDLPVRVRQDDPRHRDGAGAARRARRDALRRLDPARPLQGPGHHDHGRLRGHRRERGGQDHRPGPGRHRGRGQPRRGRLRRPVHGQHDGDGVRDDGHQPDRPDRSPRRRTRRSPRSPTRPASW